jgi:hypothetical protein
MAVNVLDKEMGVIVLNAFFNNENTIMSWLISVQNIIILAGQWISPGTPLFSTNKTDRQDITDILLKKAFSTKIIIFCTEISQDMIVFSFSMI